VIIEKPKKIKKLKTTAYKKIYNILNALSKLFNSEIRKLSFANIFLIIIFFLLTISNKLKAKIK